MTIKQSFSIGIFDKKFVPGSEGFGIVEEVGFIEEEEILIVSNLLKVGEGVRRVKKGDRVVPIFLWNYFYAKQGSLSLSRRKTIIIKLAKHWGIKTINLVRRDEIKEELKSIGADEVLNVTKEAGSQTKLAAACMKSGGKVFTIGNLESWDLVISVNDLARKVSHSFWSFAAASGAMQELMAKEIPELFQAKIIGSLPVVAKFPLEDYEIAMEQSEKQARQGKVLLVG
ncbi:hypothetical protein SELMODRAFT_404426 [Selaginella moellendorffii]|uniref:Alcohol dehydrogenase-like C-terminal domain-containing protein n=1 Tax=Selaginella moellendorffii TaxID=88036 RepID=D8QVA5_SELML|nr:hypothetical protein SELMODRAFT_404426 [Selaginella moellendorffii]